MLDCLIYSNTVGTGFPGYGHGLLWETPMVAVTIPSNTIASVSEVPTTQPDDFIAAIFPSMSSNIVGDGSFNEESDSNFASVSKPTSQI